MFRRLIVGLSIVVLVSPVFVSAQSVAELWAQITELMNRVGALNAQAAAAAAHTAATEKWCPKLTRNLQRGARGSDVMELQRWLIDEGHLAEGSGFGIISGGNATGYYGPLTVEAVKKFQCKEGVICSGTPASTGFGSVGPATRTAIARVCSTPVAQCVPLPAETRTLSCPVGMIGAITETRTSMCAPGATSPTWGEWTVSSNTCVKDVPPPPPPPITNRSGWDYDLTKKCIRTTGSPGDTNYFATTDQCANDGKQWTIAVQSESAPGESALGPVNRSFLVNGPNSPVTATWHPHTNEIGTNWTVNMKTDFMTQPHPAGDGHFTWFAMIDHGNQGGGPFPVPINLVSEHRIGYNSYVPFSDGASRLIAGAQFYYGGKSHLIEINLNSVQWGDSHPDPEAVHVSADWLGDGTLEYVTLDGAALGLTSTPEVEATIRIPWGDILARVIEKGWLTPIGTNESATQAVFIATETKNKVVTDLWHTNFRISSEVQ